MVVSIKVISLALSIRCNASNLKRLPLGETANVSCPRGAGRGALVGQSSGQQQRVSDNGSVQQQKPSRSIPPCNLPSWPCLRWSWRVGYKAVAVAAAAAVLERGNAVALVLYRPWSIG